ncbi:MAG: NUDIX domain-containing protein [Bacteroidales bacterium]|nr:NUDIX domain-containing protein [Bacteroidales bacterium]
MNQQPWDLFKKMLPGLFPILIFLVADAVWGTKTGLIVAIAFGLGELIFILLKERRFDWFIIFDTALLLLLGGVSLISSDEIFFKLKPALINCIFLVIIGLSTFSNKNILLLYSKRFLKDISIDPDHQKELKKTFLALFWMFLIHTVLIVYSAFFMSKATWAFISGFLLYIFFAVYFGWIFLAGRKKNKAVEATEEWFPMVDEDGRTIGKVSRSEAHAKTMILHPVVHLHVINQKGEIYLQKRDANKDIQPGMWDTAVGGHIGLNETIEAALKREALEELNLSEFTFTPFLKYRWDSSMEAELVFSFITHYNGSISYNPDEISDGRFWNLRDIENLLNKNILTPNFEKEFSALKFWIAKNHSNFSVSHEK